MSKYIPSIIIVAIVAIITLAGNISYTPEQLDEAVDIVLSTDSTMTAASVLFTNGWAISCTSTSLVFVAP
jgi:hypothetical protein